MSAVCKCDVCGQDIAVDRVVHWREYRDRMWPSFVSVDICQDCENKAHEFAFKEHERARNEANERILAHVKSLVTK